MGLSLLHAASRLARHRHCVIQLMSDFMCNPMCNSLFSMEVIGIRRVPSGRTFFASTIQRETYGDGTRWCSRPASASMTQAGEVVASRLYLVLIRPMGLYRMAQLFGWLVSNLTLPTYRMYPLAHVPWMG